MPDVRAYALLASVRLIPSVVALNAPHAVIRFASAVQVVASAVSAKLPNYRRVERQTPHAALDVPIQNANKAFEFTIHSAHFIRSLL